MNPILLIIGLLLISGGIASVTLSLAPAIMNAGEAVEELSEDGTEANAVGALASIAWAGILFYFTLGLTILAFIGGLIAIIFALAD